MTCMTEIVTMSKRSEPGKQRSIESFFSAKTENSSSKDESILFTTVNKSKSKLALKKSVTSNKTVFRQEHASVVNPVESVLQQDGDIRHGNEAAGEATVVMETQEECVIDVIPDTPNELKIQPKKQIQARSFLAQPSFLMSKPNVQHGGRNKQTKRKQVCKNLEDALKISNPEDLEKADLTSLQTLNNPVQLPSAKRSPSSPGGESPSCKRSDRRPSGRYEIKACTTRLRFDKEKTSSHISCLSGTELAERLFKSSRDNREPSDSKSFKKEEEPDALLNEILEDLHQVTENISTSQKRNPFSPRAKSRKLATPFVDSVNSPVSHSSIDKDSILNELLEEVQLTSAASEKSKKNAEKTNSIGGSTACGEPHTKLSDQPMKQADCGKTKPDFDSKESSVVESEIFNIQITPVKKKQEDDVHLMNELVDDAFWQTSPFKTQKTATSAAPCSQFGRHEVISVHQESVHADKILELKSVPDGLKHWCILQGFWTDTAVNVGDIVNIIGTFDNQGEIIIDDKQNLIVVNPDLLISGTSVVSTVFCLRKTVLNEKFRGYERGNIHMLVGSIIHCVFQQAIKENKCSVADLTMITKSVLSTSGLLHEMYAQGHSEDAVMEKVCPYLLSIEKWMKTHIPTKQTTNVPRQSGDNPRIEVNSVADIEENIWSPRYGIKGKLDLTVDVTIHKKSGQERKIVPLELKTGRVSNSAEHQGQVTLYCMMTGDRRPDPGEGLLCYLKDGSMTTVVADHVKRRGLLQLRNELGHYLSQTIQYVDDETGPHYVSAHLPRPIDNERFCGKCPHLINCALYQRSVEEYQPPPGHIMETLVPEALSHLTPSHLEYFKHWCLLLHLEMETSRKSMKDIWCSTPEEREKLGDCFSNLVLKPRCPEENTHTGQLHVFRRRECSHCGPLTEVGLTVSDSVILSTTNTNCIALASGTVVNVSQSEVTLSLDRDIYLNPAWETTVFRVDRAEFLSTMLGNFTQLSRLMENNDHSTRLRKLIIDRSLPAFAPTMSKSTLSKVKDLFKPLNKPQKTAILRALLAKDYVLIKGFPGSGKTSTIVALIQVLIAIGQSVLLTSYTHSAVDNILLKLVKHTTNFLRLGRLSRIHPEILPFAAENCTSNIKTAADLRDFYSSKAVVATTCLGTNHPVFSQRTFDVCILDEATQVMQPTCFGPLFRARKHILVGDPQQLPPVVQSHAARCLGMDESLFLRLDDTGATYELDLQYRMNSDIMRICNEITYNSALRCGSEEIASATLAIPPCGDHPSWVQQSLSPCLQHSVVFLDTQKVPAIESTDPQHPVHNEIEASIVTHLVQHFTQAGVAKEDLGVISPYRNQVKVIKHKLACCHLEEIEVNTVDTYQGRDKSVIIMSFVRTATNKEIKSSEILQDWRRLNVAVTRAKHKLILVGNTLALSRYRPLERLIQVLRDHQILSIPETLWQM